MLFDDRLATVLRLRPQGHAGARAQFRQLLDLLGTMPAETRGVQIDAAYARLADLSRQLPAAERAAILGDRALRLRSPRLVAALGSGEPAVAAAMLGRAQLSEEQWLDLIPALPPTARAEMHRRQDLGPRARDLLARLGIRERGLPAATSPEEQPATNSAPAPTKAPEPAIRQAPPPAEVLPPAAAPGEETIGALVKRIEAYRRARHVIDAAPAGDSPRLPLGEEHVLHVSDRPGAFDFATDAAARIVWADPGVAPMTIGLPLDRDGISTPAWRDCLRRRQPLRALPLELVGAPAISGTWQVDAVPMFDPLTGRFTGYRGRMRRPAPASATTPTGPAARDSEADRLRQMLHELRTPVNAIQGFAEVIQQQLFGPTPHEYRALAAGIAGDAARMLAAFEELERLAKLESGALDVEPGETDLAATVAATIAQLGAHTRSRGSGFAAKVDDAVLPVPLARIEVERLVWRLLATLAGTAAPGEQLRLRLRQKGAQVRLSVQLPAALARLDGPGLFAAAAGAVPQIISSGVFGVGFALRLVAAEARAAGGDLTRREDRLRLELPGLTRAPSDHSEETGHIAA